MSYEKEYADYREALKRAVSDKKKCLSAMLRAEAKDYISQLGGFTDHDAYMEKVMPYWERFAYVPEELWFEFAGLRDRVMDPRFIPSDLLYNEIIPYLNNMQLKTAVMDKAYSELLFPDVKQPVTVCRRVSGIYYDDRMNIISEAAAVKLFMNSSGGLFIKPAMYTYGSKGIIAADAEDMAAGDVKRIFKDTGMNFIVQKEIKQHEGLAVLNPDSVCTVRINTLLMDEEVHILTEVMRVGAPGERVPMHGSGSYFVQILADGKLHEKVLFAEPAGENAGASAYSVAWDR